LILGHLLTEPTRAGTSSGNTDVDNERLDAPTPRSRPAVLLIEDNPADARLMRETLAEFPNPPFSLTWVDRLSAGLERLATEQIDLVLLDLSLPDAEGLEGLRAMRTHAPRTPVVVLTGLVDEATADRALAEGAQDYLFKGQVTGDALARSVRYAIERQQLYGELQRAIEMRDQLLAVAAHDLRNPLASISLLAEASRIQAETNPPVDPARLLDQMAQIGQATTRMGRLIEDLMDAAHLQLGRTLQLSRSRTDLVELLQALTAEFGSFPSTGKHRIVFETDVPSLVGYWDRPRIERVATNLIENAVKYTPGGGDIVVHVSRERAVGTDWAVFTVKDQGIGIPKADLPRVFERFHRASNVVGRIPGTGIGLAGAGQLVEQHGGRIDAASEEGKGSTFTVKLPLPAPGDKT
jgi:signal transduction histidine kinase